MNEGDVICARTIRSKSVADPSHCSDDRRHGRRRGLFSSDQSRISIQSTVKVRRLENAIRWNRSACRYTADEAAHLVAKAIVLVARAPRAHGNDPYFWLHVPEPDVYNYRCRVGAWKYSTLGRDRVRCDFLERTHYAVESVRGVARLGWSPSNRHSADW